MATRLPQVTGGRVVAQQAPSAALPGVQFQGFEADLAFQEAARYQGEMARVLDRMSQQVFGLAAEQTQRAGLQFVAENPLTAEQLQAMSKGDMSQVQLGTPLNVFNSAVRKARALEVSGHAEAEAREQLVQLYQKAEMGEINTTQLRDQMTAMMNGYGEAIAQIDPDAAFKYRATMASVGGRVLEKVAELDGQKRQLANTVKVQRMFTNLQREVALAATTKMPIDERTGQEIPATVYIDALKENFIVNATALLGPGAAAQYAAQMDNAINESVVSSISQYLNTDPAFANSGNGIERLLRGDAGSASNAFANLLPEQRDQVIAEYRNMKALRKADAQAGVDAAKKQRDAAFAELQRQFVDPLTPQEEKVRIGRELALQPGLSMSQLQAFYNPDQPAGDPVVYERIRNGVSSGAFQTAEEVEELATQAGMNRDQTAKLVNELFTPTRSQPENDALGLLRRAAGVPDVISLFTTADDRKKIEKQEELRVIFNQRVQDFRTNNPSAAVPFVEIARDAITYYEDTTGSAAAEQAAIGSVQQVLDAYANRIRRSDPDAAARVDAIEVSPSMNPDDLVEAGVIDAPTATFIKKTLGIE